MTNKSQLRIWCSALLLAGCTAGAPSGSGQQSAANFKTRTAGSPTSAVHVVHFSAPW